LGTTIARIKTLINADPRLNFVDLNNICDQWNNKISTWLQNIKIVNGVLKTDENTPFDNTNELTLENQCRKCIYTNIKEIWNKDDNAALKDLINIKEIYNDPPTFDEKYLKEQITTSHWYDDKIALRVMGVLAGGVGLTGIADDRSWSKKDTGNILLSTEKGKMYRFGADGSFKAYMPDEANAWRAFIIKMIRGAKLT
jgi:hypothetical protein